MEKVYISVQEVFPLKDPFDYLYKVKLEKGAPYKGIA